MKRLHRLFCWLFWKYDYSTTVWIRTCARCGRVQALHRYYQVCDWEDA